MKYIDSEKLIAEIERWIDKAKETYNESTYSMGRCDALAEFRNHIVSLLKEHPEVELEKEIEEHAENMPHGEFTHDSECREHEEWAKREFRYFYELARLKYEK